MSRTTQKASAKKKTAKNSAGRKELVRRSVIEFRWWRDSKKPIKAEHVEALEEKAWERISSQMSEGYLAGELSDSIHMTDDDPEDGEEYSGWWSVKKN